MNANAIYLAVKGTFVDGISANVKRAMSTVSASCSKALRVAGSVSTAFAAFGSAAGSALGKAATSIGGVVGTLATMGPIGGIIAGISAAMELFTAKTMKAAKAAEEFAKVNLAKGLEKLNQARANAIEGINRNLAETTSRAEKAAKAFDTLAAAYLKVANAKNATEKAGGDAALADLRLQKQNAISGAANQEDAALKGAGFDVQIAKRRLDNVSAEAAAAVKSAALESRDATKRAVAAADLESKLKAELATAERELADDLETDSAFSKALRDRRDKAQAAYEAAVNDRIAAEANAEAAAEAVKTAQLKQAEAVSNATAEVVAAQRAQKELAEAQQKAKQAQLDAAEAQAAANAEAAKRGKLKAEEKGQRGLLDAFTNGLKGAQTQAADSAQKADEAFQRFANPKAFREQDRADKEAQREERRFQDQFKRLQKRKDWRTADLHGGDEAVRRVALAREKAAQDKKRVEDMQKDVAKAAATLDAIKEELDGVAL